MFELSSTQELATSKTAETPESPEKSQQQLCDDFYRNYSFNLMQQVMLVNSMMNPFNLPPMVNTIFPAQFHEKIERNNFSRQIFNHEAFCDICEKEFCNKYFLRIHKINKHGVNREEGPLPHKIEAEDPNDAASDGRPSLEGDQTSNTDQKGSLKYFQFFSPKNDFNVRVNTKFDENREKLNSMRVKCQICGKEVCNKYFLRTHMKNRHGKEVNRNPPRVEQPHKERVFEFNVDNLLRVFSNDGGKNSESDKKPNIRAKSFVEINKFIVGRNVHQKKFYFCRKCGKNSSSLRKMTFHVVLAHQDELNRPKVPAGGKNEQSTNFGGQFEQSFLIKEDSSNLIVTPTEIRLSVREKISSPMYFTVKLYPHD